MLSDSHGRIHDYLRISLTEACNFRCFYCMPDVQDTVLPPSTMKAEEISALARVFVRLGVKKIRLTGGEPLVRKDLPQILEQLARLPVQLTMTTNGYLLDRYMDQMETIGMKSVNVSLDSLQPAVFLALTRRDHFERVYANIQALLQRQFSVKVNMVVIRGINEQEITSFVEWTKEEALHIRFIEFMPFAHNPWNSERVYTAADMLQQIGQTFSYERLPDEKNATAKKFKVPGHAGTFAIISTMTNAFCDTCNRLRLTADGKMKNCLFSKTETDLLTPFRRGDDIETLIRHDLSQKAEWLGGQLAADFTQVDSTQLQNRSMISIGG